MLTGLFFVCVYLMIGDVLLGVVRRTHRVTLARYGIVSAPSPATRHRRERSHGAIRDYLVLGDELLVELDVRSSRRGRPTTNWARCDASAMSGAVLQRWRDGDVRIDIEDRHGFLTLRCDDETVQLVGLSPQRVGSS